MSAPTVDLRSEVLRYAREDQLLPTPLLFRLPTRPANFTHWWTELVGELEIARTTFAEDGAQSRIDLDCALSNLTVLLREAGLDGHLDVWQVQ